MANDKRFIARNGLQSQSLLFVDQNSNNAINVSMLTNDTLSFSGNTGQLFSITDSLSGVIFAVNDISGLPSIEVDDDGTIRLAETFGNVLIGTATNGAEKVQIAGDARVTGRISANNFVGPLFGNANTATVLQTARTINGASFNGSANITVADPVFSGYLSSYSVSSANTVNLGGLSARYLADGSAESPTGVDHALLTLAYSAAWAMQLAGDWRTNTWYSRTRTNSVPSAWNTILSSDNIGTYAPALTGTGATGTWAISVTGNSNTASALQTARTISLGGDLAGSASFNGTSDITITATIAANSVALGSDTTGNYVATIAGTANEIEVTGSGSETAAVTVGLPDSVIITNDLTIGRNLTITGNLVVTGNTTIINANNLAIEDNMIYLNNGSTITNPDLGIVGNYNDGSYTHTGIFRDATDNRWKFFKRYDPEPDASIDTAHASFVYGDVQANNFYASAFTGALVGNATTATTLQTARSIGDVSFNGSASIVPERINYKDTRAVDFAPYSYTGLSYHFKTNTTDGLSDGGSYHGILNLQKWGDNTGGNVTQLGVTDNNNLYIRTSSNSTVWGTWDKIYDTDDASSSTVASKLVLRDSNGSFSTNNINAATLTTSGELTVNGFTNANDRIILVDSGTWSTGSIDPGSDGSLGIYNQHSTGASSSSGSATGIFSLASLYTGAYNHTNASYGDIIGVYAYSQGSGNAGTYISKAIGVKSRIEESGSGRIQEGIGFESSYYGSIDTFYGFKQNALEFGPANTAYGFYSAIANASNTYNFYAASTAKNYFGGNVGIGTTSPSEKLQVAGNILGANISGTNVTASSIVQGNTITAVGVYGYTTLSGFDEYSGITTNGNGIGFWDTSSGKSGIASVVLQGDGLTFLTGNSSIGTAESARITADGNLGIGLLNPSYKVQVVGTVAATDFDTLSDRNLKENIANIPNAIDKVNAINGVYFNFKGQEKKHIGVIAQEVEAVLPEVISVADNGIKSVSYGNLIAVLIEAVKEQQKQIDELKSIILNK